MNPLSFAQQPWGIAIALYFALAGAVSGLPLMAEALIGKRHGQLAEELRHAVFAGSTVLVAVASALLILDLGRPERFFLMLSELSWTAPISLGAKLVALDGYVAASLWFLYSRLRSARARGVQSELGRRTRVLLGTGGWFAIALSLAVAVYPAFVVADSYHFPLGAVPGAWLVFLISALTMGTGAVMLLGALRGLNRSLAAGRLARVHRVVALCQLGTLAAAIALVVFGDFGRASTLVREASPLLATLVSLAIGLPTISLFVAERTRGAGIWRGLALVVGGAAARCAFFAT